MKKSWFSIVLFSILGIVLSAAILLVCLQFRDTEPRMILHSDGPEKCAQEMLSKAAAGDFTGMSRLFYGNQTGAAQTELAPYGQTLLSAFTASFQYELLGASYAAADGISLDVRIRSVSMPALMESMQTRTRDLLNERVSAAESPSEIFNEENEYLSEFTDAVLRDAAAQTAALDGRAEEKTVTMHFVCKNGKWLILPEQAVLNAVSGGILS